MFGGDCILHIDEGARHGAGRNLLPFETARVTGIIPLFMVTVTNIEGVD
jgi:hypothetical protein